jgi:hypothetical protein
MYCMYLCGMYTKKTTLIRNKSKNIQITYDIYNVK